MKDVKQIYREEREITSAGRGGRYLRTSKMNAYNLVLLCQSMYSYLIIVVASKRPLMFQLLYISILVMFYTFSLCHAMLYENRVTTLSARS